MPRAVWPQQGPLPSLDLDVLLCEGNHGTEDTHGPPHSGVCIVPAPHLPICVPEFTRPVCDRPGAKQVPSDGCGMTPPTLTLPGEAQGKNASCAGPSEGLEKEAGRGWGWRNYWEPHGYTEDPQI